MASTQIHISETLDGRSKAKLWKFGPSLSYAIPLRLISKKDTIPVFEAAMEKKIQKTPKAAADGKN